MKGKIAIALGIVGAALAGTAAAADSAYLAKVERFEGKGAAIMAAIRADAATFEDAQFIAKVGPDKWRAAAKGQVTHTNGDVAGHMLHVFEDGTYRILVERPAGEACGADIVIQGADITNGSPLSQGLILSEGSYEYEVKTDCTGPVKLMVGKGVAL